MNYIKVPNIPTAPVKCVIADYRINPESVKRLNEAGVDVIFSVPLKTLYDAVNGHPDMQIHHLGDNRFLCAKEVYEHYMNVLPKDIELICGNKNIGKEYPYDILYNAAVIGDCVVCNKKFTAPEIVLEYKNIINVKQGYAKCSIAIISPKAVITSDRGIYDALETTDIDVLLIKPGEIRLDGVSHGFIGGACGLIAPDILAVNGKLSRHSCAGEIYRFCEKRGVRILELNDEELYDIGSIIPIY